MLHDTLQSALGTTLPPQSGKSRKRPRGALKQRLARRSPLYQHMTIRSDKSHWLILGDCSMFVSRPGDVVSDLHRLSPTPEHIPAGGTSRITIDIFLQVGRSFVRHQETEYLSPLGGSSTGSKENPSRFRSAILNYQM